ncbi:hypothetical protein J5500_04950 [Candidatus Saccharibacteria bacterium]|nr:hypothetical protein [Candidatus Saccharibacteria bacterium]
MLSLKKLVTKISDDYPELQVKVGERFRFSPPNTIFYPRSGDPLELLHELGHYLLNNFDYHSDIELLEIESQAWARARELCAKYGYPYDEDYAEDRLDSYRDWLHFTSLCHICDISGYQDYTGLYHCPLCGATWQSRIRPE